MFKREKGAGTGMRCGAAGQEFAGLLQLVAYRGEEGGVVQRVG